MPATVHLDQGQGPVVVLVHGVGAGPDSFRPLVELLDDRFRCVVVERPGPDGGGRAVPLADQVDQLADLVTAIGGRGGRLVGVSGGATLGLLVALRHPDLFSDLLLHEPLVGHHAPILHSRFAAVAGEAAADPIAALEAAIEVMGVTAWNRLGDDGRAWALGRAARWQAEIPLFAAFDPTADDLRSLADLHLVVSVGARSGPERAEAAEVLRELAGAAVVLVPGAANAAQLDAPSAFAQIVRSHQIAPTGGTR